MLQEYEYEQNIVRKEAQEGAFETSSACKMYGKRIILKFEPARRDEASARHVGFRHGYVSLKMS
jgi:hypothetical protein